MTEPTGVQVPLATPAAHSPCRPPSAGWKLARPKFSDTDEFGDSLAAWVIVVVTETLLDEPESLVTDRE